MKKLKSKWISLALYLFFIFIVLFRIFLTLQTDFFSSDQAYLNIRYTENILKSIIPDSYDKLSYSGRPIIVTPGFYYILALFRTIFPLDIIYKILPEILISTIIIVVFFISKEITKDEVASLIAAIFSGIIPLVFKLTINQLPIISLAVPLIFLIFYQLIKTNNTKIFLIEFIIFVFLLSITHLTAMVLLITLIFYLILIFTESIEITKIKREMIFFAIFLVLLIQFLIFKNGLSEYGIIFIFANIPQSVLFNTYYNINILSFIKEIGIPVLLFGSYGAYQIITKEKNEKTFILLATILSIFLTILIKLITFPVGLVFLSITLSILSSISLSKLIKYLKITKFSKYKNHILFIIVLISVVLLIIPSYSISKEKAINTYTNEELNALNWIREHSNNKTVVLSYPDETNFVTYYTNTKNVMDYNYLLAPSPEIRLDDINGIYSTWSRARAITLLRKYKIDYIYLSKRTKEKLNIKKLGYTDDVSCFINEKNEPEIEVWKFICKE